jgi:hypothetical protein
VSQGVVSSELTGESVQGLAFRVRRDLFTRVPARTVTPQAARAPVLPHPASVQVPVKHRPAAASVQPTVPSVAKPGLHVSNFKKYLLAAAVLTAMGVGLIFEGNKRFNAPMYDENGMLPAAQAFARGENFANFDLNINIRKLREFHVAEMTETPEMVLFGASHWQEAHKDLIPNMKWYNSHIHREFWEDLLGMAYIWESNGRMPKKLVIALRDNIFAPMPSRPDYLWEPGIPNWRKMADKLGVDKEPYWKSLPWHRFREKFSLGMLFNNVVRWANADELPHETAKSSFKELDVLLPDGSITWSSDHMHVFTKERTLQESLSFAKVKIKSPPLIEQRGVDAFEKLIQHLQKQGVTIYFVQPPYNPQFWDAVQGTAYMEGLKPVIELQKSLAEKYGIKTFGGFDPKSVGCVPEEYIDSEHANPACLQKIFNQFIKLDKQAAK